MPEAQKGTIGAIREYFDYEHMSDFRKDWGQLTEKDKADLRQGISDGTLDY